MDFHSQDADIYVSSLRSAKKRGLENQVHWRSAINAQEKETAGIVRRYVDRSTFGYQKDTTDTRLAQEKICTVCGDTIDITGMMYYKAIYLSHKNVVYLYKHSTCN